LLALLATSGALRVITQETDAVSEASVAAQNKYKSQKAQGARPILFNLIVCKIGASAMPNRALIVIGASAGGIEALQQLLKDLPADFAAAVLIVLHTSSQPSDILPAILQRSTRLPVSQPSDGEVIRRGSIYVAPPDFHMIVEGNLLKVVQGPKENLHRPAIDPLFRSAAAHWGRRAVGVVLTGLLDDGTSGLMVLRARGAVAIVQDPATAMFSAMPRNALEQVPDALVLPLSQIAPALEDLVQESLPAEDEEVTHRKRQSDAQLEKEIEIAEFHMSKIEDENRPGHPSPFACPDCGGVLWEMEDQSFLRFRCRVGHAFTARHLGTEQRHAVETALWSALRALEESASLYRRMADRAVNEQRKNSSDAFANRAADITANARVLKDFLLRVNQQEDVFDRNSDPQTDTATPH
jgi:two-component system, chemotaxis family, protein-glutamate methylesterase/glutaminase